MRYKWEKLNKYLVVIVIGTLALFFLVVILHLFFGILGVGCSFTFHNLGNLDLRCTEERKALKRSTLMSGLVGAAAFTASTTTSNRYGLARLKSLTYLGDQTG